MAFELPPLPYAFDALEPHIDARTMEIHHDRHHKTYVDNANAALSGTPLENASVDEVLRNLSSLPADKQGPVRNNAGGHANHSLFWKVMDPGGGGDPTGALAEAVNTAFGSADQLREKMTAAGTGRFGSGWSWLVWNGSGLEVTSTPNQDSPLLDGNVPLLGIDVWEHAYYLNYQNRRPDYLKAFWNVVNWDEVARNYEAARS